MNHQNDIEFYTLVQNSDFIVRDHQIHQVRIIAGMTFLDLIYRVLNTKGFVSQQLELRRVLFKKPVVTTENYDQNIQISLKKVSDFWKVTVSSQKVKDSQVLSSGWDDNLECELHDTQMPLSKTLNIQTLKSSAIQQGDIDEFYALNRKVGLSHYDFMKGLGHFYKGKDYVLAELQLSELAQQYLDYFYLHPAYLDSALNVSNGLYPDFHQETQLFIPFYLEAFRTLAGLSDPYYYVYVENNISHNPSQDVVDVGDIGIYNRDGQIVTLFQRFAAKQVRSKDLITKLEQIELPDQPQLLLSQSSPSSSPLPKEGITKQTQPVNPVFTEQTQPVSQVIIDDLRDMVARIQDKRVEEVNLEAGFYEQGLDSTHLLQLVKELENKLGEQLYPTLLFEYTTIKELTAYLEKNYADKYVGQHVEHSVTPNTYPQTEAVESISTVLKPVTKAALSTTPSFFPKPTQAIQGQEIAIIGISGRYPQAENLAVFWDNLKAGKDCIVEIPENRWDYRQYYDPDRNKEGSTCSKWGGFIEDIDKFDALFFNISGREAEILDPQERVFLETVWQTLEDASYTRAHLASETVGVFVGIMWGHYQLFGAEESLKGHVIAPNSFYASVANRVSYFFNFTGPSLALDTICSSSLTSIHLACESILRGESTLAIAGGVNFTIHPSKYILLSQAQLLSSDGRCRSFAEGGDGYVPSEGVGAVLLKPLNQAIADGDSIYAVIKGSAINHSGKASAYTVPNPRAQANLILSTLQKANINPRTISYLEGQGTGTLLGDAIEVAGLTQAYQQYTQDKQYCSIGSVKSNIGHAEAAGGMAGLTKILLQMKHKQLVSSLHCDQSNPNINFKDSPFFIQRQLTEWKQPIIQEDGEDKIYPRRAAISAFGATGANAHLILEEYEGTQTVIEQTPQIIVLSAKNDKRLQAYAKKIIDFLTVAQSENRIGTSLFLADFAYTLQIGREAMKERLAMVVSSLEAVKQKLTQYQQRQTKIENFYQGNIKGQFGLLTEGREGEEFIKIIVNDKKLNKLAQLWISGVNINWLLLYPTNKPQRISLPTYPFARERYWIPISNETKPVRQKPAKVQKTSTDSTLYCRSVWKRSILENKTGLSTPTGAVLLFDTDESLYQDFKQRFQTEIILVTPGERYQVLTPQTYSINPNHPEDYRQLLLAVSQQHGLPSHIIHFWSQAPFIAKPPALDEQLAISLYSCFHLSQALLEQKPTKPIQLLYLYLESPENLQPQYAALSGFAKTIRLENPKLSYKTIALYSLDKLVDIVETEFQTPDVEVRYDSGQRWIKRLQEFDGVRETTTTPILTENGVYLITGGAGGLGLIFAEYLAKHFKARLVLTGRSALNEEQTIKIQSLNALDASVIYYQADISKRDDVVNLITQTKSHFNQINGIIHSAGVIKDAFLVKKTPEEMATVLAPKVYGTIYLDEATQNEPLDFFVLFSSIAAVMGNLGQCDYAYANSFMDNFTLWRERLRASQQRFGKTLAINWALWQSGGMFVNEQIQKWLSNLGIQALSTETGLKAFSQVLSWETNQYLVIEGHRQKIKSLLGLEEPAMVSAPQAISQVDSDNLQKQLQQDLLTMVSEILKVKIEEIDIEENISEYGFNSFSFTAFTNRFNEKYQLEIMPGIFFEHSSITAFSQFLCQEYQAHLLDYYQGTLKTTAIPKTILERPVIKPNHSESQVPFDSSSDVLEKGGIVQAASSIMYQFQDDLPKLPLPPLEKTCQHYLQTVKPFLSDAEFANTSALVQNFQQGEGLKLQKQLEMFNNSTPTTYTHELTKNRYLKNRSSLPFYLNTGLVFNPISTISEWPFASLTAHYIIASLKFYLKIKRGELTPDKIENQVWCMSQYANLFSSSRIPGLWCDSLQQAKEQTHLIVIRRNVFYSLTVIKEDDSLATVAEIAQQIDWILENTPTQEPALGVFTTLNRTQWAILRTNIITGDSTNAQSMALLDKALFVVCLDETSPPDLKAVSQSALYGDGGCNRWFDKAIQLIFTPNGQWTLNIEHTGFDGLTIIRAAYDIHQEVQQQSEQAVDIEPVTFEQPTRLLWHLNEEILDAIQQAKAEMKRLIAQHDTQLLEFNDFGENWITQQGFHADAVVQFALQLAYFRLYGKLPSVYEPIQTRKFRYGRTEGMHPVTSTSVRLIKTITEDAPYPERNKALKQAVADHISQISECLEGRGIERHLSALHSLASYQGIIPDFFQDKAYTAFFSHADLATTGGSMTALSILPFEISSFGPVFCDDPSQYGISYKIDANQFRFNITSWDNTETIRFIETLRQCLLELGNCCGQLDDSIESINSLS
jgi:acyl transferase domain-containing protein/acyl carrier protein